MNIFRNLRKLSRIYKPIQSFSTLTASASKVNENSVVDFIQRSIAIAREGFFEVSKNSNGNSNKYVEIAKNYKDQIEIQACRDYLSYIQAKKREGKYAEAVKVASSAIDKFQGVADLSSEAKKNLAQIFYERGNLLEDGLPQEREQALKDLELSCQYDPELLEAKKLLKDLRIYMDFKKGNLSGKTVTYNEWVEQEDGDVKLESTTITYK